MTNRIYEFYLVDPTEAAVKIRKTNYTVSSPKGSPATRDRHWLRAHHWTRTPTTQPTQMNIHHLPGFHQAVRASCELHQIPCLLQQLLTRARASHHVVHIL